MSAGWAFIAGWTACAVVNLLVVWAGYRWKQASPEFQTTSQILADYPGEPQT